MSYHSTLFASTPPFSAIIIKLVNHYLDQLLMGLWDPFFIVMLVVIYKLIPCLLLGKLRLSEQQHQRELFWDYLIQKSIFFCAIYDKIPHQRLSRMPFWYTCFGFMLLLSSLCRDRFYQAC